MAETNGRRWAGLIYRGVVTALIAFLYGPAPLWEETSLHFGIGFFPHIAGMILLTPVTLLLAVNLCFSVYQWRAATTGRCRLKLGLDMLSLAILAWAVLSTPGLMPHVDSPS